MYIKLNENKELVVTRAETLYRGENLATTLTFLIPLRFGDLATADSTLFMSYIRPDGVSDISMMVQKDSMYNENYFQFTVPVDCKLTLTAGKAVIWLQARCDVDGKTAIAKSGECALWIRDTQDANGLCADDMYTAIYQLQAELRGKADNLIYDEETRHLRLTSDGAEIGDAVTVPGDSFEAEDGELPWSDMSSGETAGTADPVASWEQM